MYAVTHFQQFVIIQCSKFILCYILTEVCSKNKGYDQSVVIKAVC